MAPKIVKQPGVRMQVVLDEDAYRLLGGLTSPHRKGEYLSDLIRRAAAEQAPGFGAERAGSDEGSRPDGMQLLQRIEERLARIEEKLDEAGRDPGRDAGTDAGRDAGRHPASASGPAEASAHQE